MIHAGIIAAVEIDALKNKYGEPDEIVERHYQKILCYEKETFHLYVISSGVGEIAASAATQLLISEFNVDMILNFGVVGGLTEDISKSRLCIVDSVVHYDFDTSEIDNCEPARYIQYPSIYIPSDRNLLKKAIEIEPTLKPVICASADKFVGDPERKKALHEKYNAEICEMEAAAIIMTCDRNHVPCLLIKMVVDGLFGGADEYSNAFMKYSTAAMDVLDKIIQNMH